MGFPERQSSRIQPRLTAAETFQCEQLFDLIREYLEKSGKPIAKKVNARFGFKVTGGPGNKTGFWLINLKHGATSVVRDGKEKVDVTFTIKDADLVKLMMGKLQPQSAFLSGKLKVSGKMSYAMKLQQIIPKNMTVKSKL